MKISKKIICILITAAATVIAALIMRGSAGIINIIENVKGTPTIINGDPTIIQLNEKTEQEDERERPYTVRQSYTSEQSGEPGIEYNFVCIDTRLVGNCYVTYYTYDVTYY